MKRVTLFILSALLGLASMASAATATPTPNQTATAAQTQIQQTQTAVALTATYIATAFPTLTPTVTLTPGGTITPTATFTPAPKQLKNQSFERNYQLPNEFMQANGVSYLLSVSTTGAIVPWLGQVASQTVAVLSTGAAEVRIPWVVPYDFKGNLRCFMYANDTVIGDNVSVTANVNIQHFNDTTQTVGTFSYTPPTGGAYSWSGTSNVALLAGLNTYSSACLWDNPLQVVSRIRLPVSGGVSAYSNAGAPYYGTVKHGDFFNLDIVKAAGNLGLLEIYAVEFEYDNAPGTAGLQ